jgi:hypothetical protein
MKTLIKQYTNRKALFCSVIRRVKKSKNGLLKLGMSVSVVKMVCEGWLDPDVKSVCWLLHEKGTYKSFLDIFCLARCWYKT